VVHDGFACLDSTLTSPSISSASFTSAPVSNAVVGSNPFSVGGVYPTMAPMQQSPQYMLVQTGSGACYVPVTYGPFVTTVMSPQPVFSSPQAAVQFQLQNPQQPAPVALHGQIRPANPFLVINSLIVCRRRVGCVLSLLSVAVAHQ